MATVDSYLVQSPALLTAWLMRVLPRVQAHLQPVLPCGAGRVQSWCDSLAQGEEGAAGGARQQLKGYCFV